METECRLTSTVSKPNTELHHDFRPADAYQLTMYVLLMLIS